jgi:HK97 family phage major capsid protein
MSKIRSVAEVQEELAAKQRGLAEIFEAAKNDNGELVMTADQVDDVRAKNEELDALGEEMEKAREMDTIYQKNQQAVRDAAKPAMNLPFPGAKAAPQPQQPNGFTPQQAPKSLGKLFVDAKGYKNWESGNSMEINFKEFDPQNLGRKTLMETGAGFAPESVRTGRVIESAQRRPMVDDMIPQTTTTQAAVVYMEETTFTNNAAEAAEGAQYGEAALVFTERSDTIRKIGTFLPVTDEQLEDEPQIQSLINNRLALMVRLRREAQLLAGNGTAPNLLGFYNKTGIQTQAKGSDPVPDAIYKAMTKVRHTGYADPTAVILHPNDWQDIRLLRTTEGIYIWGSPAEAGPERVWGLPVVATSAATENTGLVGDFQLYSELHFKRGITLKVSDSHSDYFIKGKQAIRADERLALAIYRAAAFCTVTSI